MFVRWKPHDVSWRDLTKRVWAEMQHDDVFGNAAKLAYYFLLALFPLLIFLTSVIGIIIGSGSGMRHVLFNYLARVMPSGAFQLINQTMLEVSTASGAGKLSFGFVAALWAASSGMGAITAALNAAYKVPETRPWWWRRITAIGLTIALAVLIITALAIVLGGSKIADHLTSMYVIGRASADRKSTRLNSSHTVISYAVFCLKKKKNNKLNINTTTASLQLINKKSNTSLSHNSTHKTTNCIIKVMKIIYLNSRHITIITDADS